MMCRLFGYKRFYRRYCFPSFGLQSNRPPGPDTSLRCDIPDVYANVISSLKSPVIASGFSATVVH